MIFKYTTKAIILIIFIIGVIVINKNKIEEYDD